MSFSIGLVGLPNAGKSTLFNALTSQNVLVADYAFATVAPNHGIINVPDERLPILARLFQSQKTVWPLINFVDIAGLVQGASQGEGLGNQFLSHIRQTAMIVHVVNAFTASLKISHNLQIIETELMLADWQTLDNQRRKLQKLAASQPKIKTLLITLQSALDELDDGQYLARSPNYELYQQALAYLNLLTLKPHLYVFNLAETELHNPILKQTLSKLLPKANCLWLCAKLEMELGRLTATERPEFLSAYQLPQSGLDTLAQKSFQILNLQTFFTAGRQETKAWTIPKNCLAPRAAGVIHSDMQRGFIAADIVNFENLKTAQSWAKAKALGYCRTEGKRYQMQDGDVVEFKFNL